MANKIVLLVGSASVGMCLHLVKHSGMGAIIVVDNNKPKSIDSKLFKEEIDVSKLFSVINDVVDSSICFDYYEIFYPLPQLNRVRVGMESLFKNVCFISNKIVDIIYWYGILKSPLIKLS